MTHADTEATIERPCSIDRLAGEGTAVSARLRPAQSGVGLAFPVSLVDEMIVVFAVGTLRSGWSAVFARGLRSDSTAPSRTAPTQRYRLYAPGC